MENRQYNVKLYLYDKPLIIQPIEFYQNDSESCSIEFEFNSDRINKFDLTNKTVEVRVTKQDLTTVDDVATITGLNTAVWELKLNAISFPNNCTVTIYVYEHTERLTFGTLKYKVIADTEIGNVSTQPEYPILTQLIADTQDAINETNQTNDNISAVESTRVNNENARVLAEGTRVDEFNGIKSEYETFKNIIIDENNVANLQNQIFQKADQTALDSLVISAGKSTITVNAVAISVVNWAMGIATVDLQWGTGHFEGSCDNGITYQPLSVMNIETGTKFSRIDMRGKYCLDLRGVTHLKYIIDYTAGGLTNNPNSSVDVFTAYSPFFNISIVKASKRYEPNSLISGTPATLTSGRILDDVDLSTGTLYAHAGANISKSIDYGVTWLNIINSGQPWGTTTINNGVVKKLKNGKVLVIIANNAGQTEIYLSDANEANFTKVYNFTQEGIVNAGFGLAIYQDIILFAPYKQQPRLATDPIHIHMSKDSGLTWSTIFTAPSIDSWHLHDVAYDPYTHRIWLTTGDNYGLATVQYTDDYGVTWIKLWEDGKSKTQITSINIMPDCVIFGTDQVGFQGAYIYYKSKTGGNDVFEPCYSRGLPGRSGDASYRGKQYWDCKNVVYYTSKNPTAIIATKDGVNFYEVWSTTDATTTINLIFGIDVNNKIIGYGSKGAIIANAPTWDEI